jgi:hypothetical protein
LGEMEGLRTLLSPNHGKTLKPCSEESGYDWKR